MQKLIEWQRLENTGSAPDLFDSRLQTTLRLINLLTKPFAAGRQLTLYLELQDALTALALAIVRNAGIQSALSKWISASEIPSIDPKLARPFLEFAWKAGILQMREERYRLRESYRKAPIPDVGALLEKISKNKFSGLESDFHPFTRAIRALVFIATLVHSKNAKAAEASGHGVGARWFRSIEKGDFDYELLLCEFLIELARLDLRGKIAFSQPETFFTEMGRRAFRQFIKSSFEKTISELSDSTNIRRVLDVGCGHGDHIDALANMHRFEKVFGIERQKNVATTTSQRFCGQDGIEILNGDALELHLNSSVDLILLNYVTFYFSESAKDKLFAKLAGLLSSNGRIVLCQYFPRIEHLQKALCLARREFSFQKKSEMFFGNRTIYAEILLNDALATFQSVDRWEELLSRLKSHGLKVTHLTNADPFYYSLFVVIGHT